MVVVIILSYLIVFCIGAIIGIYLRELFNLLKKPPDDDVLGNELEHVIEWIEKDRVHERK